MEKDLKDLLLQDLCARLPYGVKFKSENAERVYFIDTSDNEIYINGTNIEDVKPYLFPLSSMTDEQAKEMQEIVGSPKDACIMRKTGGLEIWLDSVDTDPTIWLDTIFEVQDWLNAHHFDYRCLIEKDLAIDATGLNIY